MLRAPQTNRGELTERLIRILFQLAERPRSQRELAQLFGVESVTIRRNLNELSRHYFIEVEMNGREKVNRFDDHYEFRNFIRSWMQEALLSPLSTGLNDYLSRHITLPVC